MTKEPRFSRPSLLRSSVMIATAVVGCDESESAREHPGAVHGARSSGRREAERAING